MTQYLPANLLALFTARPPIPFKPPPDGLKKRKNGHPYSGISEFMHNFEKLPPPPPTKGETREQREERKKREHIELADSKLEVKAETWDPHSDPNASGDPFKTLFVGRVKYETSESKLRREMEAFGPVRRISLVYNMVTRKPRGYAFVEFEHERDMHSAFKHADGKKIDGRRVVVDVERGRTVKSWRPRRLGGGLGGTRLGGPDDNVRHSGRVEQWEGKERDRGDREREDRDHDNDRDRDRERDRRDGDREKDKDRGGRERRRRSRSRERGDRGDRDRDRERRRDRDRDRGDREERDRGERDRGERDRGEREERERGDREDRERGDHEERDRGERDRREREERDRDRGNREERDRGEREERDRGEREERDRGDREDRGDRGDREDRDRDRRDRNDSRDRRRDRDERGGGDEYDNRNNHSNNDPGWKSEDGEIKQEDDAYLNDYVASDRNNDPHIKEERDDF